MRGFIIWLGDHVEEVVVAVLLIAFAVLAAGCCATVPERASAARDALDSWLIVRDATVPHPDYGEAERAELERAELKLEAALSRLAEAE